MAVFPDRIILKNSTDTDQDVRAAISTGGSDAIAPGEIVIRAGSNSASLYTLDSAGNVVEIAGGGSVGAAGVTELNYYDGYVNNFKLSNLADVDADGDANWSSVTTLIPGVSTSTDVADGVTYGSVSNNTISNVVNATVDPAGGPYLATSFRLTAGYFSANGTTAAFGFGADSWTIEGWYKFSTLATRQVLMSNQASNATNPYLNVFVENGQLKIQTTIAGVAQNGAANFAPDLDTWYHISINRTAVSGSVYALWVKQDDTGAGYGLLLNNVSGTMDGNRNLLTIGAIDNNGIMESASTFNVADFRISKGLYRYDSQPHHPPLTAHPNNDKAQADNDVVIWNATSKKWLAGGLQLGQLADVDLSNSPATGDSLTWDGLNWVAGPGGGGGGGVTRIIAGTNVTISPTGGTGDVTINATGSGGGSTTLGRGDGGDIDGTAVDSAFVFGVWGGGDLDTTTEDKPVELVVIGIVDGGDIT